MVRNKFHAKPTTFQGMRFASHVERDRYIFLKSLEDAGKIQELRCQVPFRTPCGVKYVADFVYIKDGEEKIEDVKGVLTAVFKLKSKMLANCLKKEIIIIKHPTEKI